MTEAKRRGTPRPRNGGVRPDAGRKNITNLNNLLSVSKLGVYFATPATLHADVTIGRCTACGAVWWERYNATLRGEEQAEPDVLGNYHLVLAEIEIAGHSEIHKRDCVFYEPSR